jgi:hypothetical protein
MFWPIQPSSAVTRIKGKHPNLYMIEISKLLTPYEQFFMQSLHKTGRLIPEQSTSEPNPLFKLAIDPHPPS